jgi:hypothetical protein
VGYLLVLALPLIGIKGDEQAGWAMVWGFFIVLPFGAAGLFAFFGGVFALFRYKD